MFALVLLAGFVGVFQKVAKENWDINILNGKVLGHFQGDQKGNVILAAHVFIILQQSIGNGIFAVGYPVCCCLVDIAACQIMHGLFRLAFFQKLIQSEHMVAHIMSLPGRFLYLFGQFTVVCLLHCHLCWQALSFFFVKMIQPVSVCELWPQEKGAGCDSSQTAVFRKESSVFWLIQRENAVSPEGDAYDSGQGRDKEREILPADCGIHYISCQIERYKNLYSSYSIGESSMYGRQCASKCAV